MIPRRGPLGKDDKDVIVCWFAQEEEPAAKEPPAVPASDRPADIFLLGITAVAVLAGMAILTLLLISLVIR